MSVSSQRIRSIRGPAGKPSRRPYGAIADHHVRVFQGDEGLLCHECASWGAGVEDMVAFASNVLDPLCAVCKRGDVRRTF